MTLLSLAEKKRFVQTKMCSQKKNVNGGHILKMN